MQPQQAAPSTNAAIAAHSDGFLFIPPPRIAGLDQPAPFSQDFTLLAVEL
jgi:hypothetical protein